MNGGAHRCENIFEFPAGEDQKKKCSAFKGEIRAARYKELDGIVDLQTTKNHEGKKNRAGASEADSSNVFTPVRSPFHRVYTDYCITG